MDPEPATEVMYAIPSTGTPRGDPEVAPEMLVLHVAIQEGSLVLWGETPPGPSANTPPKRGRTRGTKAGPRAPATAPALPFDAGVARLAEALTEAGVGVEAVDEEAETKVAWLPTVEGRPVASSPLIDEPPANAGEAGLAPWAVSALRLRADRAATCSSSAPGDRRWRRGSSSARRWSSGPPSGSPGRWWPASSSCPAWSSQDGSYRARWEPVLAGADPQRLTQLARAMPTACRALGREPGTPPEIRPTAAASAFVAAMVDHLVRSSADRRPPPPRGRRRGGRWRASTASTTSGCPRSGRPTAGWRATRPSWSGSPSRSGSWRRPIAVAAAAPFRLCFRLEEPRPRTTTDEGKWVVREPANGRSATCSRRPTTPACWCRSPTPGSPGRARRRSSGAAASSPASTCCRPWGRRRRSAPGSRRA